MNEKLTEIVVILDRSGSMLAIKSDVIGGFNQFLKDQQELPSKASLTLAQFDNEYEIVHDGKPIEDVPELNNETYMPRAMTRLLDAIGRTIVTVGERLHKTPEAERPGKVVVAIITDGLENDSKEYRDRKKVMEMVKHQQEKYNWEFIFLAANQDAIAEGMAYGIGQHTSCNFTPTSRGTRAALSSFSGAVKSVRASGTVGDKLKSDKVDEDKDGDYGI